MLFGVSEKCTGMFSKSQQNPQGPRSEKGSFSGTGPYKHMHLLDLEKSIRQQ